MRHLTWLIPVGLFFLNPGFACGTSEPAFQYGAPELRAAVEGDWALTITPQGGAPTQMTVHVVQGSGASASVAPPSPGGLVRTAYACGTRTLVRSAAACIDVSQMPLAVSYVAGDPALASAPMSGTFNVYGLLFTSGDLELMIGTYQVLMQVKADGSLVDPHLGPLGTTGTLVVTRPG